MPTQRIIVIPYGYADKNESIANELYGATFDDVEDAKQRVYNEVKKKDNDNAWNLDHFNRVFACMSLGDFLKDINEGCGEGGFVTMVFIKNI